MHGACGRTRHAPPEAGLVAGKVVTRQLAASIAEGVARIPAGTARTEVVNHCLEVGEGAGAQAQTLARWVFSGAGTSICTRVSSVRMAQLFGCQVISRGRVQGADCASLSLVRRWGIGLIAAWLHEPDLGAGPDALPEQAHIKGLQLFEVDLQLLPLPVALPDETPPVQATSGQPDAEAIVNQRFHLIGALACLCS